MTPKALLDEILRLPPKERLELLEDVWDSLDLDPKDTPDWQREELDRRLADPTEQATYSLSDVTDHMNPPLTPEQRSQFLAEIRDRLVEPADTDDVPAWHLEEIARRMAEPTDPAITPWREVLARLRPPER